MAALLVLAILLVSGWLIYNTFVDKQNSWLWIFLILGLFSALLGTDSIQAAESPYSFDVTELVAPLESRPQYPFTKAESVACGHWSVKSQDFPYFKAPRDKNTRNHAGIDIYPPEGRGARVRAIKDGTILKIAPFYTRTTGEVTYGMLVDHGDFVVNYAELQKPGITVNERVKRGQTIGAISGTRQLHFELYTKGTNSWLKWYGPQPSTLIDPTPLMMQLFSK